jgi:hypothetical protein
MMTEHLELPPDDDGDVTVSVKGRTVSTVEAGGLIGEAAVMSKSPATAR